MKSELARLIDEQDPLKLQDYLTENPALDLNSITKTGMSALFWALNPPKEKSISQEIIEVLLATQRINPTLLWHKFSPYDFCPEIQSLIIRRIADYENNYVNENRPLQNDLGDIANDAQNTHDPLIVKQYDAYIQRLYECYPKSSIDWQADFDAFIETMTSSDSKIFSSAEKQSLIRAIQIIKNDKTSRHAMPALRNAELLMLIWYALKDINPANFVKGIDMSVAEQKQRQLTFLKKILEAQSIYGPNSPACFMGTRHLLIQTLDKVHQTCSLTLHVLRKEQIEELYTEHCTDALQKLAQTNRKLYDAFLQSLFIELPANLDKSLNDWIKRVKQIFWDAVLEYKKDVSPEHCLSPDALEQCKVIYFNDEVPLFTGKTPEAALALCLSSNLSWLKKGNATGTEIIPALGNVFDEQHTQLWLTTHYTSNVPLIRAYLCDQESAPHPLYSLFLNLLSEEEGGGLLCKPGRS